MWDVLILETRRELPQGQVVGQSSARDLGHQLLVTGGSGPRDPVTRWNRHRSRTSMSGGAYDTFLVGCGKRRRWSCSHHAAL